MGLGGGGGKGGEGSPKRHPDSDDASRDSLYLGTPVVGEQGPFEGGPRGAAELHVCGLTGCGSDSCRRCYILHGAQERAAARASKGGRDPQRAGDSAALSVRVVLDIFINLVNIMAWLTKGSLT